MNERVAIHNIEAECALLGAILINNTAYGVVAGAVSPDYFFEPLHQEIYSAIGTAISASKVADPTTLPAYLPPVKIPAGHGIELTMRQYLLRLASEATTIINAPDYALLIRELWELRQICAIGAEAGTPGFSPKDALEQAWSSLDTIRAHAAGGSAERSTIGAFTKIVAEEVAEPPSPDTELVPSTGFTDVDRFIGGGYRPGRLYVFAGRPGMGKTVYAVASARRVAMKGHGVAFFSLEIDGRELGARIMAADLAFGHAPIAYADILSNNLDDLARKRIAGAAERFASMPIEVDASGGLTMFEIAARARIYVERWRRRGIKPGILVIDYLGLVTPSDRYRGRKVDEAGEIAKGGKDLAKRLDVSVVMLSQLNRTVEGRDDKRPQMNDLRDSGNIEEHADVVGLLYRPAYYDQRDAGVRDGDIDALARAESRRNDLEVGLGKNRLGPTSSVTLWCDVGSSSVDNMRKY